jgi:L-asparaginase II
VDLERLVVPDHDRERPRAATNAQVEILLLVLLAQHELAQLHFDEVFVHAVRKGSGWARPLPAGPTPTILVLPMAAVPDHPTSPAPAGGPLADVLRGDFVESRHFGHLLVADAGAAAPVLAPGSLDVPVVCRSAIKSLQALPLLERGVADELRLSEVDLALVVASHEGTDRHVAAVRDLLERTGLREDDLPCGPHAPFDAATRRAMLARGEAPARAHNNCSGKHAGFLMLTRALGRPLTEAVDPDAEPQRLVRAAVADLAGVDPDEIGVAVDGCGAPTLELDLSALARAFARLMDRAHHALNRPDEADVRDRACARILTAVTNEPFYLSGDGRLCAALVRSFPGRVWPKNGAEGVYVCGVRPPVGPSRALAIKVVDGATRGYEAAVVLSVCALLGEPVPESLQRFVERPVRNTRGDRVGVVRPTDEVRRFAADLAPKR